MKITSIRLRRLQSFPYGFGHVGVEMEAEVQHALGETPEQVLHDLRDRVDAEVREFLEAAMASRQGK